MKKYNPIYWQQIPSTVTFVVGLLVVLSGIFGTFALTQYRMDKFEETQKEANTTITRLDRSVLVIATKLGITEEEIQVQAPIQHSVTYQYVQNVSEPSASPKIESPVFYSTPAPTRSPDPIPVPTPTSTPRPVKSILNDLKGAL